MDLVEIDDHEKIRLFQAEWKNIEIEIGSGNGHFLAAYAAGYPGTGFIGIEARKKRCLKIKQKLESRHIKNVLIFHGSAESFLDTCIHVPIKTFHIYFPDPWPKKKQRRRRFMKKIMIQRLANFLISDGKVCFASDVFDYYLQVKILALLDPGIQIAEEDIPDEARISLFCVRTAAVGRVTNSIVLKKRTIGPEECKSL